MRRESAAAAAFLRGAVALEAGDASRRREEAREVEVDSEAEAENADGADRGSEAFVLMLLLLLRLCALCVRDAAVLGA